jgi:hypothetical protein
MLNLQQRPVEQDVFRFLVSPYHPDTLRYPADTPTPSERLRHALTWNVFRTLEQVAPSLWMRPLVARCAGLPDGYDSAPHVTTVTCWSDLRPAPSAMLRRGRRSAVPVSVIVETDDTVLAFLVPAPSDLLGRVLSETAEDGLLDVAEATASFAGTRSAYVSVVLPIEADGEVWTTRVRRRAERVRRVLQAGGRGPLNIRGMGATTWDSLHEMLSDIAASTLTSPSEQHCARATTAWMGERLRRSSRDRQRLA